MTLEGDSVTISGQAERGATVRVVGNSSSDIDTTFKIPLVGSGSSFSIVISPLTAGRHTLQVKAFISGKKETVIPVTIERPFKELQFDITGEYVGEGEVKASVTTNLWKDTEVDLNVFSVSKLNPDHDASGGIDYSRWYTLFASSVKNLPITQVDSDNFAFDNTLLIPESGIVEKSVLLFHPEALAYGIGELDTMKRKYMYQDVLATSIENQQTFGRDRKVVLDFRISRNRFNEKTSEQESNLNGTDISTIKLPKGCKLLTSELYGQQVLEIQCTKELIVSGTVIADEKKKAVAAREKEECSILTNTLCYFYVHKQGNVTWQQAKDGCTERGGDLPSKTDAAAVREGLATLYASYPSLSFVWTKETQGGYGWVEGFIKNFDGEYRSDWATANSDKRDYVAYVCVKKR